MTRYVDFSITPEEYALAEKLGRESMARLTAREGGRQEPPAGLPEGYGKPSLKESE